MKKVALSLLSVSLLFPSGKAALAQVKQDSAGQPAASLDREQLKQELKQELREELKEELGGQPLEGWEKEVVKKEAPPLKFLDLHGYFRLRPVLFHNLDLGNGVTIRTNNSTPLFPEAPAGGNTLAGANMRLRLEPTINVTEEIRVNSVIDVLDNYVLGSTPDGFGGMNPSIPMLAYSQTQVPGEAGHTALHDSIEVKRAWAEVMTPIGQLRFGRMGSNWGLGVLANDGNCLDCDYGDSPDRIMFITKLKIAGLEYYVVPAWDFVSEGYTSADLTLNYYAPRGQPFDLDQTDDVNQWILAIAHRHKNEDIAKALENHETIFDHGVYLVYRNQPRAWDYRGGLYGVENRPDESAEYQSISTDQLELQPRNARAFIPDIWLKLMWEKLRIETEFVMIIGEVKDPPEYVNVTTGKIKMMQYGGVLQADYLLARDTIKLGFEGGFASGDSAPGFGVYPGKPIVDTQATGKDNESNNFRFNPDYIVDMILFRQLIGAVTDAFYIKPQFQYSFLEGVGVKFDVIYSQAIYEESTPGGEAPLGLEFDGHLFYLTGDGFNSGLSYGLLIPFGAFDKEVSKPNNQVEWIEPGIAQAIKAYVTVKF